MLDKINEFLGVEIKKSTYVNFMIVLFGLFFIIVSSFFSNHERRILKPSFDGEIIKELFDKIEDNYSLDIDIEMGDITKNVLYSRDKEIELYEGNYFNTDGFMIYNNKVFELSDNKLSLSEKEPRDFDNAYCSIDMFKKIIDYCEYTYINPVKVNCKMKLSDYLKEYNNYKETSIATDYDDIISFDIVYYSDAIGKILFDYSKVNEVITGNDDYLKYGVRIASVSENDFSDLHELNKDILDK